MDDVVAGATEPGDLKWLIVIIVVGVEVVCLDPAAFASGWALKATIL